jgi:DNA repair protein RecO (recombination protein O)
LRLVLLLHLLLLPSYYLTRVIYQTRAVVLRTVKYGETSLIVDMYTEQKGFQTFMVHSVRKARATTPASYLQVLSLVDMVAYHHDQKKINHIKEIRLDHAYQSISFDMRKSSVITCLAEITSKSIPTAYAQPDLFLFLHDSLVGYDNPANFDRDFLIRFLVQLTQYLGFEMAIPLVNPGGQFFDLMEGRMVPARPHHLYTVEASDLNDLKTIMTLGSNAKADISLETRRRIIDLIIVYYQLHVETLRDVNSLRILRELL